MQTIEIFKAGTHTAMDGRRLSFTEADIAASAAAYDPMLHEAPLVVGHPRDNAPAYGWVAGLSADGGALAATPQQVDPAFAELVQAGRFKKISASFYAPDSPQNPKPGVFYLRHVGFLGAQPPAVKGLRPVAFADGEAGIVEFADGWTTGLIASLFGRLREAWIAQFGQEKADQVLPRHEIEAIQREGIRDEMRPEPGTNPPAPTPAFTEPTIQPQQETPPVAAPQDRSAEFAERETALAQREATLAARERAARAADDAAFVDGLIAEGRLLPANRSRTLAFMAHLDATGVVEFAEGDKATPRDAFRALLQTQPTVVEFRELAGAGNTPVANPEDPADIAAKSVEYQEAMRAKGIVVGNIEAIKAVTRGQRA